jgi:hypothetical protein
MVGGRRMTREEAVSIIEDRVRVTEYVRSSYVDCVDIEALKMAIEALKGKDTNVPSRKGVFIPYITVELFRNAPLAGVEELIANGEMEDISLPPAQPSSSCIHENDSISRQAAIDALLKEFERDTPKAIRAKLTLEDLPSAQPEQRYTEEELRVFQHGISLSLLSKRSSQYWQYDEDTATEIKFLERLYEKVDADMRGEQDDKQ